jgi:hypothetical protein
VLRKDKGKESFSLSRDGGLHDRIKLTCNFEIPTLKSKGCGEIYMMHLPEAVW